MGNAGGERTVRLRSVVSGSAAGVRPGEPESPQRVRLAHGENSVDGDLLLPALTSWERRLPTMCIGRATRMGVRDAGRSRTDWETVGRRRCGSTAGLSLPLPPVRTEGGQHARLCD